MFRGRGSFRRGRGNRASVARRVTRLARESRGVVVKCPPDPPRYTQIPWNSIVLNDQPKIAANKRKNYIGSDFYEMLRMQTGLNIPKQDDTNQAGNRISFRLQQVRIWNISGGDVNLQVYDLTIGLGNDDYLVQVEDLPGRNQWARVGYVYPISQQMVVFSGHDKETILTFASTSNSTCVVQLHLLWKSRSDTLPNLARMARILAVIRLEDQNESENSRVLENTSE